MVHQGSCRYSQPWTIVDGCITAHAKAQSRTGGQLFGADGLAVLELKRIGHQPKISQSQAPGAPQVGASTVVEQGMDKSVKPAAGVGSGRGAQQAVFQGKADEKAHLVLTNSDMALDTAVSESGGPASPQEPTSKRQTILDIRQTFCRLSKTNGCVI